jgi:hypothetical protein
MASGGRRRRSVTTVGYGDVYPLTTAGAIVVMLVGIWVRRRAHGRRCHPLRPRSVSVAGQGVGATPSTPAVAQPSRARTGRRVGLSVFRAAAGRATEQRRDRSADRRAAPSASGSLGRPRHQAVAARRLSPRRRPDPSRRERDGTVSGCPAAARTHVPIIDARRAGRRHSNAGRRTLMGGRLPPHRR